MPLLCFARLKLTAVLDKKRDSTNARSANIRAPSAFSVSLSSPFLSSQFRESSAVRSSDGSSTKPSKGPARRRTHNLTRDCAGRSVHFGYKSLFLRCRMDFVPLVPANLC